MYLVLDKNRKEKRTRLSEIEKQHNKGTISLAEAIRAKRQLAVQKGNYGFLSDEKENSNFIAYFEKLARKRKGSNSDNWLSTLHYLNDFSSNTFIRFKDLNEGFCNDFKEFLLTAPSRKSKKVTLAQNSAVSYFNKFKASLKQAYKEGYLEIDLNKRIETIKQTETSLEGQRQGIPGGTPPEIGVFHYIKKINDVHKMLNKNLRIHIGEWGWDINAESPLNAPAFGKYLAPQTCAMWTIRALLGMAENQINASSYYRIVQDFNADDNNATPFATMALLRVH